MHYFKHVGGTWLLAHAIHPFVLGFWILQEHEWTNSEAFGLGVLVFIIAALLTMPLLFWLSFVFKHTLKSTSNINQRLGLWYALVMMNFIAYSVLACLLFLGEIPSLDMFIFIVPALISITISLLIRIKSFNIICSIHDEAELEKQSIENIINYNQP